MSITLAQLGLIHEYGNDHVPARPFLLPALQEGRAQLQASARIALSQILRGQISKRDALGKLGGEAEAMVKMKLRTGPFKPLALSTINRRIGRMTRKQYKEFASGGGGSVNALIDTGQMLNNVQWEYDSE